MKFIIFCLLILLMFFSLSCDKISIEEATPIDQHEVNTLTDELAYLYRMDLLPQFREGSEVAQISSYDTTGGNNDGFSGLFSYIRREGSDRVIAELEGPGVIERIWTPTPSEDTISFYFDGENEPRISLPFIDLFGSGQFPFIRPVSGNEVGGYYSYVPIPYKKSCKIVFEGDDLYFHQIQYRKLKSNSTINSFPVKWREEEEKALEKASELWSADPLSMLMEIDTLNANIRKENRTISIKPGDTKNLINLTSGGRILAFVLSPANVFEGLTRDLLLEIRWDDDSLPAVFCPVADFFGYAYGKTSMKSILIGSEDNRNYCLFPMPFDEKASVMLHYRKRSDIDQEELTVNTSFIISLLRRDPAREGKFYAEWKRVIRPEDGRPYVLQESSGRGHHVGTILLAQGLIPGMTGFFEGDDSTRIDHELRIHGTGSEDYFNGGWYALANRWDRAFSLPVHGCLDYSIPFARTGGYRFYMADKLGYSEHFYHTIEHGPVGNTYPVDYTSIAFYYSESAPKDIMEPVVELLDIYVPDTLIILPNLIKVTVGINQSFDFLDWSKGVLSGTEAERPTVIHLDEIPPGRYQMFFSYQENPEGCDFTVWQRQQKVSGTLSSKAEKMNTIENRYIGTIKLDQQYRSISIKKMSASNNESLILTGITLVKE